jgi:hypothetical protein
MDNCSPDDTPEVVRSFRDQRVIHIRNKENIGHLRNYNKGIELARGEYVWLVSADDRLCRHDALERYVTLLDAHPKVNYALSSALRLQEREEQGILEYSQLATKDMIFEGRRFLQNLIRVNRIVASSVVVRRECYQTISAWPIDLPWASDWYLWSILALHGDVAYFAEPMVCCRIHTASLTSQLTSEKARSCAFELLAVPWRIRKKVEEAGARQLAKVCLQAIADEYTRSVEAARFETATSSAMTLDEVEESLRQHGANELETRWLLARAHAAVADRCYWHSQMSQAQRYYISALRKDPWMPTSWLKLALLSTGALGNRVRKSLRHGGALDRVRRVISLEVS